MNIQRGFVSILGISTLAALTGCEAPRERRVVVSHPAPVVVRERVRAPVIVTQRPPAPVREVIPPSPGHRYVWTSGYWTWDREWIWQSGQWTLPPQERVTWHQGHWAERHGEWYWEPGYWR